MHHADEIHQGKMLRCAQCGDAVQIGSSKASSGINKANNLKTKDVRLSTPRSISNLHNFIFSFKGQMLIGCTAGCVVLALIGASLWQRHPNDSHNKTFDHAASNGRTQEAQLYSPPTQKLYRTLATGTRLRPDFRIDGKGLLSIDNGSDSDALVKVLNTSNHRVIRYVFIQQFSNIDLRNIPQGTYMVRFCFGEDFDAEQSGFTRPNSFFEFGQRLTFEEIEKEDRTQFTREEITLHTTPTGNVPRRQIDKSLFNVE